MAAGTLILAASTAAAPAAPLRSRRWFRALRWLGTVFVVVFFIRTFLGEASVVPTGSMEGTIMTGDHIFLDKALYGPTLPVAGWRLPQFKTPHRGEIIAFLWPKDPSITFLKRVIAVGGDTIAIRNDVVYVNGVAQEEPYAVHRVHERNHRAESMAAQRILPGHLFVMGDNRDDSSDSRYWGTVPVTNVVGEPLLVYWSYDAPSKDWLQENPLTKLEFYASIGEHLFSRTRWDRVGTLL